MGGVKDQKITDLYAAYNADCMDVLSELPDASVHLSVYSPPFATSTGGLYTYSSNERDLSNCQTYDQFFEHYAFIVEQVARVTMPGRVSAIHCTDIPSGNTGRDYLIDFPGDIIRLHQRHGFEMIARHTIWKEPLWVRNRTMGKNLAHQTVVNDAAFAGVASADYMLMFRKAGKNPVPIANPTGMQEYAGECPMPSDILPYKNWKGKQTENVYSHWIWRRYASSVWDDIRMQRVLPFQDCKDPEDEKHVHPLQLDVIDRTIALRSNPGEVVLTPFMGVGSEVYSAVKSGRRAIGAELKPSYYRQSIANLEVAEREIQSGRSILNHVQADMFGDLDSEAA
jgi:DNA modification methylase